MSQQPEALPFAVFDEFGNGADDRVQDHIRAQVERLQAAQGQVVRFSVNNTSTYPAGTKAMAINGGYWVKVDRGWKWGGPNVSGGTFPRPGGDWCGDVELPAPVAAVTAMVPLTLIDGQWYLVSYEGLGQTYRAPAMYKADANCFYSWEFSGVPVREAKVHHGIDLTVGGSKDGGAHD